MENQVNISKEEYERLEEKARLKETFFELLREPVFRELIAEIHGHLNSRIPPKQGKKPFDPTPYYGIFSHLELDAEAESRKLREEWTTI